jgi:NAD(P)-dependent dehydrogenase (short-subunit alcohol dehydrogenase family)
MCDIFSFFKVCVVTGGNTGIGYETCLALAQHNAKVYVASRVESRAREAMKRIEAELAKDGKTAQLEFLHLELDNLRQSKAAAEKLAEREFRLDILSE